MTDEPDFSKLFAEAADKIRRDAYQAGWRDALAALTKAAAEAADVSGSEPASSPELHSSSRNLEGAPTVGSTPWYVLQTVRKRPGMTGLEVVSAVQEGGHKVSGPSIRTSLARLARKKLIVARHKRWFPA